MIFNATQAMIAVSSDERVRVISSSVSGHRVGSNALWSRSVVPGHRLRRNCFRRERPVHLADRLIEIGIQGVHVNPPSAQV
jgi:hypothetical protein